MSNLKSLNKSIGRAHKIMEDAAATMSLTMSMKNDTTTFVIPADGLLFGQLRTELLNRVSPRTQITREGDTYRIVTNNPTVCVQALKGLGISTNVEGTLLADVHTRPAPAEPVVTTI